MPRPVTLLGSEYTVREVADMSRTDFFDFVARWRAEGNRPILPAKWKMGTTAFPNNQWGYYSLLVQVLEQIFDNFIDSDDEDGFEEIIIELEDDRNRCSKSTRGFDDSDDDDDSDEDDSDEDDDDGDSPTLVDAEPVNQSKLKKPKKGLVTPAIAKPAAPEMPTHTGPIKAGMPRAEIEKWCMETVEARAAVDYDFLISFKVARHSTYSPEHIAMNFAAVKDVPEQVLESKGYVTLPMQLYCADKRHIPTTLDDGWKLDFTKTRLTPKELATVLWNIVNVKSIVNSHFVIHTDGYDPRFVPMFAKVLRGSSTAVLMNSRDKDDFAHGHYGCEEHLLPREIVKVKSDDYMIVTYNKNRFFIEDEVLDIRALPRRQKALEKNFAYAKKYGAAWNAHKMFDELNAISYIEDDSPAWHMNNHVGMIYFRGLVPPPDGKTYEQGKPLSMLKPPSSIPSRKSKTARAVENRMVIYGDAPIDYAKLLETDVKEFARNWIETLLKDVKRRHKDHKIALEKAHAKVRQETRNLAETTILLSSVGSNPRLQFEQIVGKLRSLEMVESVQPRQKSLMIELKPIYYQAKKAKVPTFLGKYKLGIGLGFDHVSIENSQAHRRCHPHVAHNPCLGGYRQLLNDAVLNTDVYQLVLVLIEFLSNVNEDDSTAMDYYRSEFKPTPGKKVVRTVISFDGEIRRRNEDEDDDDD